MKTDYGHEPFAGKNPEYRLSGIDYRIRQWCSTVSEEQPYQKEDDR
jgi:hypothetical protein